MIYCKWIFLQCDEGNARLGICQGILTNSSFFIDCDKTIFLCHGALGTCDISLPAQLTHHQHDHESLLQRIHSNIIDEHGLGKERVVDFPTWPIAANGHVDDDVKSLIKGSTGSLGVPG
jgi:hypothetical protein